MEGLKAFKRRILIHCVAIGVICEIGFVIARGFHLWDLLGIAIGTVTTMINFVFLVWSGKALVATKRKAPVIWAYFIRLPIYGMVFYLCLRLGGKWGALGCAVGFVTLALSIMVIYGIESHLPGAKKNPLNDWTEPKKWRDPSEWDDEDDDW